ncbi:unnamed protein product, partial [Polarella glacialis]
MSLTLSSLVLLISGLVQWSESSDPSQRASSLLRKPREPAAASSGSSEPRQLSSASEGSWINVCYFTNWARYRNGLINQGKDIFEMGIGGDLCTHFMYGFASVKSGAANGGYELQSNDPNADHPSGDGSQGQLCPKGCNDPNFVPDWNDPSGLLCDWPCSPSRVMRGYEGLTVGMKTKNPAIKALISVGGWNFNDCAASASATYGQGSATCEVFSDIAASEDKTRQFAANVISFCRKWGFDGFDLDWEYPVVAGHNSNTKVNGVFQATPQDHANYIAMLRIMKEEFSNENPSNPLLLTAAVGVGKATADTAYDIPGMSEHLDLINLMTYDLHGAWEARTGCNANLFATEEDAQLGGGVGAGMATAGYPLSVSWAVDYWLSKGAPAAKLTMGLGAYGRGWTLADPAQSGYNAPVSGPSAAGSSTGEAGYRSYYEIQALIAAGAAEVYDEERQCPYVVSNGEWIGYDNERSLCAKLAFAKSRSLAGSMVWALDLDDFTGQYSGGASYPLISLASTGGSTCGIPSATTTQPPVTTQPETTSATSTQSPVTTQLETPSATTTQPPVTTQPETTAVTTTQSPVTTQPETTSQLQSTMQATTSSEVQPSTSAQSTTEGTGACVRNLDCVANTWCQDASYDVWCAQNAVACPSPQCTRQGSSAATTQPETTSATTTQPETTSATTTQPPVTTQLETTSATTTQSPVTTQLETTSATTTQPPVTSQPETTAVTTTPSPVTTQPETTSQLQSTTSSEVQPSTSAQSTTEGTGACVRNLDCVANTWCQDASYDAWCAQNAVACPSPQCTREGIVHIYVPATARWHLALQCKWPVHLQRSLMPRSKVSGDVSSPDWLSADERL